MHPRQAALTGSRSKTWQSRSNVSPKHLGTSSSIWASVHACATGGLGGFHFGVQQSGNNGEHAAPSPTAASCTQNEGDASAGGATGLLPSPPPWMRRTPTIIAAKDRHRIVDTPMPEWVDSTSSFSPLSVLRHS